MSVDYLYYERESAYETLVDEIAQELKEQHREEAIGEFVQERLRSYYLAKPDVVVAPRGFAKKAEELLSSDPVCSLIYSSIATEVFIKSVILGPIIYGLVHSEAAAEFVTSLIVQQSGLDRFHGILNYVVGEYAGIDLTQFKREGSDRCLWAERKDIQGVRNRIMHKAASCTAEEAQLSFQIALHVFWIIQELLEALGFALDENRNIVAKAGSG